MPRLKLAHLHVHGYRSPQGLKTSAVGPPRNEMRTVCVARHAWGKVEFTRGNVSATPHKRSRIGEISSEVSLLFQAFSGCGRPVV